MNEMQQEFSQMYCIVEIQTILGGVLTTVHWRIQIPELFFTVGGKVTH